MAALKIENYDKYGNKLEVQNITLKFPLLYVLLKKYMKEV